MCFIGCGKSGLDGYGLSLQVKDTTGGRSPVRTSCWAFACEIALFTQ
jgi:hypothetical protein